MVGLILIPGIDTTWGNEERRILQVLLDGESHSVSEFYDEDAGTTCASVRCTIGRIRAKLETSGYLLVTTMKDRKCSWQLVRHISHDE